MILHKAFTGHLIEIIITTSHPSATDIEFTYNTYRQFVSIAINDKLLNIQLWLANGDHLGICQFRIIRSYGNLRWTITVEDAGLRDTAHLLQEGFAELLTSRTTDLHL